MNTNEQQPGVLENTEKPPKKCLFIDDHPLIIMGVAKRFEDFKNFSAAECHNVEEALNAIRTNMPDVLFLDHSLSRGGSEGIEIANQIMKEIPGIKIYSTTTNPNNYEQYEQIGIEHINKDDLDEFKKIVSS